MEALGIAGRIFPSGAKGLDTGFALVLGFIGLLLVYHATSNYNCFTDLYSSQFATARTKSSLASLAVTW
jgi:hypothetical protein